MTRPVPARCPGKALEVVQRAELVAACRELTLRGLYFTAVVGQYQSPLRRARFSSSAAPGRTTRPRQPEDIALLDFDGRCYGRRRPSSESGVFIATSSLPVRMSVRSSILPFPLRDGPGVHGAWHTGIPLHGRRRHRWVLRFAGAPYRTFGTQELSDVALSALARSKTCLLANHSAIAAGADVREALKPWPVKRVTWWPSIQGRRRLGGCQDSG